MIGPEQPLEEMHNRSYFLLKLERIECDDFSMKLRDNVGHPRMPLGTHGIYVEGNMVNISIIIPINISKIHSIFENIYIDASYSPSEVKIYIKLFK